MTRVGLAVAGLALALSLAPPPVTADQGRLIITVASLAPEGSVWDLELKQLGSDWQKLSNGAVSLRIAPGGRLGSEPTVIRQLRAGARPEAAALTTPNRTKAGISRNDTTCCGGSTKAGSGPMWMRVITVPITELITIGENAPSP